MDNQRKTIEIDTKTLTNILDLIIRKPEEMNNPKNKKLKNKIQQITQLQNNPKVSTIKITKKRNGKAKKTLNKLSGENESVAKNDQNSENLFQTKSQKKRNKNKLKRLQNKLDQQEKQSLNKVSGENESVKNDHNSKNLFQTKSKRNKNKLKRLQNKLDQQEKQSLSKVSGENESVAKDDQNSENLFQTKSKKKRNKKKLKRLQNKPEFKLDQQEKKSNSKTDVTALTNNPKLEKQVEKDLLNVKLNKPFPNKNSKPDKSASLREKMQNQLKSSRFRYLNEQLYTTEGKEAREFFQLDRDSFEAYHEGFRQQVAKWPMNPLDKIIAAVKKRPTDHIIADFGCGEAKLARSVPHKVYSFDLAETVPGVIACDMAHCKLPAGTVDVAVYCLSLMGTNLQDYLAEANRVLKIGGILKIAEVESRFDNIDNFIQGLQSFGFKIKWKDLSHNLFYFLDFTKEKNIKNKNKLPTLSLQPCLYKKR